MWCKVCERKTTAKVCEICGSRTFEDVPIEVFFCKSCAVPVIFRSDEEHHDCPFCGQKLKRLASDLRPVFPEERLLLEILTGKPLAYLKKSVWAVGSRYYIDGKPLALPIRLFHEVDTEAVGQELERWQDKNSYAFFDGQMEKFIGANRERCAELTDEAMSFIRETAAHFGHEEIVISFSGGKDSTVTADLVSRALANPSLVHIFGDTTLEFPSTLAYAKRFRTSHPQAIFKVARNREQDFYKVASDIGPPARLMRWCCTMFKTGPISRALTSLFRNGRVLTFYGVRKFESVSRSKYRRVENDASSIKIQRQTVASPVFLWHDIDIWLYILTEKLDFNEAYRLGYERVGCWCCPNGTDRSMFLSHIYMSEAAKKWRDFLINFARSVGKPDPEEYVDSGNWKSRQGGNGLKAAEDIRLDLKPCTLEEHAKVYRLNKPMNDDLLNLFTPLGIVSKELGRKLLHETLILDARSMVPILSVQPFTQDGYEYAVKIKTLNAKNPEELQRMASYQIKKFNACRKCLKCEALCPHGAISIHETYYIDEKKCRRCRMCVTAKYLDGGCLMDNFLKTNLETRHEI